MGYRAVHLQVMGSSPSQVRSEPLAQLWQELGSSSTTTVRLRSEHRVTHHQTSQLRRDLLLHPPFPTRALQHFQGDK